MGFKDDAIIDAYLADLDRALAPMPPEDRAEITAGIMEHIESATLAPGRPASPSDVRAILSDLGSPHAVAGTGEVTRHGGPSSRWVPLLVAMVAAVAVATIAFPVPWPPWVGSSLLLAGALALMSVSPLWNIAEKSIAVVLGFAAALSGHYGFGPLRNEAVSSIPVDSYPMVALAVGLCFGLIYVICRCVNRAIVVRAGLGETS